MHLLEIIQFSTNVNCHVLRAATVTEHLSMNILQEFSPFLGKISALLVENPITV